MTGTSQQRVLYCILIYLSVSSAMTSVQQSCGSFYSGLVDQFGQREWLVVRMKNGGRSGLISKDGKNLEHVHVTLQLRETPQDHYTSFDLSSRAVAGSLRDPVRACQKTPVGCWDICSHCGPVTN